MREFRGHVTNLSAPARANQRGFTLVELLVAIAILAMLLALLLPAVQRRESACAAQCVNNLRQIGLALHDHLNAKRLFPPAYVGNPYQAGSAYGVNYPDGNGNGPSGFAWGALILPFVEQQSLYERFDFTQPCWSPANAAAAQTKLPLFLCPSASGGDDVFSVDQYVGSAWNPDLIPAGSNPYSPPILLAHAHYVTMPAAISRGGATACTTISIYPSW